MTTCIAVDLMNETDDLPHDEMIAENPIIEHWEPPFIPGAIMKCGRIKKQHDPLLQSEAKRLNYAWVRIMDQPRNPDGQIRVLTMSKEHRTTYMAVPERKLKRVSKIIVRDYSAIPEGARKEVMIQQKIDSLSTNPNKHILILPRLNTNLQILQRNTSLDLSDLIFSIAVHSLDLKQVFQGDEYPEMENIITDLMEWMAQSHPEKFEILLDRLTKWTDHYIPQQIGLVRDLGRTWEGSWLGTLRGSVKRMMASTIHDKQSRLLLGKLWRIVCDLFPLPKQVDLRRPERMIGAEIIKYWLKLNDEYHPAPDLCVIWTGDDTLELKKIFPNDLVELKRMTKAIVHPQQALIAEVVLERTIHRKQEVDDDRFYICGRGRVPCVSRLQIASLDRKCTNMLGDIIRTGIALLLVIPFFLPWLCAVSGPSLGR